MARTSVSIQAALDIVSDGMSNLRRVAVPYAKDTHQASESPPAQTMDELFDELDAMNDEVEGHKA